MGKIDLSVVILSFNTRKLLKRCLGSVVRCLVIGDSEVRKATSTKPLAPNTQIIVVDNNSDDESPEMVKKEFPQVKLIRSKKNLGFAGGNNLGLKKASGRYILFLNSDTELFPNTLKKAVDFMETDQKIGAMTPKTMLFSGGMDPDCHRGFPTPWASFSYFLGLEKLFPKSRIFGQYHKLYQDLNKAHEIDAGFGTFMIIRKDVYKEVGGFDDNYFFYGEDLDYFYRIKQAGWKVMFYPKALLRHHKGGSSGLRKESKNITPASRSTRIKTAKASIKAMEIFYKKFYKEKYPGWVTFLVLLAIKIKSVSRLLKHYLS